MLESLGYREVPERADADLILFNTCSIREKADDRFVAHLHEAKVLKRRDPERVIGVGGCWAQSVKEQVFRQFPFVDVAFGPGQVHKLAEFLTSDSLTAQGYFEFEGFTGHLPPEAGARRPGLDADLGRLQLPLLVLHRPLDARARGVAPARGARRRGPPARGGRRHRAHAARPERQRVRPRPAPRPRHLRAAAGGARRDRRRAPDPLHEPAPEGHARGRHPRPRRAGVGVRAHPPAAPGRRHADPQGDAPHLHPRALPRPRRADPRARARRRADDRHHRRLPGGDRGRLRRDARRRRGGRLRRGVHVHLLPAPRDRGRRRSTTPCRTRRRSSGCSAWSRSSSAAPASAPSASSAARSRCSSRAPRAPIRAASAAGRATTRWSTSPASPDRASTSTSRSPSATSQTLLGEQVSLLVPSR